MKLGVSARASHVIRANALGSQEEQRLRRILAASGTGIWEADLASGQVTADQRQLRLWGFSGETAITLDTAFRHVHQLDRERVARSLSAAIAGDVRGSFSLEYRVAPYGVPRHWWVQTRGEVEFGRESTPRRVLGTSVDVTSFKEAEGLREHAAEEAIAELEAILQSLPDALYVGDRHGIRRANAKALAMLGYESHSELERDIGALAAEIQTRKVETGELIPVEDQAFTRALAGHVDVQEVLIRHLRSGEDRVVRCAAAPIRVGGEVVAAVAVNTDITEAKQAERTLRERAELEKLLIGIVSHDLRNPLGAILLGTAVLLRRNEYDERTEMALQRIQRSAERAARLVNDLLDFTQARLGGTIPIRHVPVDLAEIVRHALEEAQLRHPSRDIRLTCEGAHTLDADPDRVAQIINNLLDNALKYSPEGSAVTVSLEGDADQIVLGVHNQGTPIPGDIRGRLFEPMRRGSLESQAASRSVGLGLFIVYEIVRAHGGSVEFDSSNDRGTTFTVTLPKEER